MQSTDSKPPLFVTQYKWNTKSQKGPTGNLKAQRNDRRLSPAPPSKFSLAFYRNQTECYARLNLANGVMTLGRDQSNDLVVQDADNLISRRHALIAITASKISIKDTGSTNGTFLNGKPISRDQLVEININDTISLGGRIHAKLEYSTH
jgi:hypothetical protein